MKLQSILIALIAGALGSALTVYASSGGSLDSPGGPTDAASQSYTLQDIYNRLTAGTAGSKSTEFTEPASGPGDGSNTGTMRSLNEIMDKAPAVNASGATAADVANGKIFWGLTSGAWGQQTGSADSTYNAGVPKTGQTTPSLTGDDGDLQKGVAWPSPRFTDNGDGTVTDNLTGLIWLLNANCYSIRTWISALSDANNLKNGECGLSDGSAMGDWRLPNVREMQSLVDYGDVGVSAGLVLPSGHPFTGVQSSFYWTSTTKADVSSLAWLVTLAYGDLTFGTKADEDYVWPVRGGQ